MHFSYVKTEVLGRYPSIVVQEQMNMWIPNQESSRWETEVWEYLYDSGCWAGDETSQRVRTKRGRGELAENTLRGGQKKGLNTGTDSQLERQETAPQRVQHDRSQQERG